MHRPRHGMIFLKKGFRAPPREARATVNPERTTPRRPYLRAAQPPDDEAYRCAERCRGQRGAEPVEGGCRKRLSEGLGPGLGRCAQVRRQSRRRLRCRRERDRSSATRDREREPCARPHRTDQRQTDTGDDDDEQLEAPQTFAFHTHIGPSEGRNFASGSSAPSAPCPYRHSLSPAPSRRCPWTTAWIRRAARSRPRTRAHVRIFRDLVEEALKLEAHRSCNLDRVPHAAVLASHRQVCSVPIDRRALERPGASSLVQSTT